MVSGKLQQFGTGDRPSDWSALEMQAISDAAQAFNNLQVGPGLEYSRVGTSAILNRVDPPTATAPAGAVSLFEFESFEGEYTTATDGTMIAVPHAARQPESDDDFTYVYDGQTRTSTRIDDPEDVEHQRLHRQYKEGDDTTDGDEIIAVPADTGLTAEGGEDIQWQELSGRAWHAVLEGWAA